MIAIVILLLINRISPPFFSIDEIKWSADRKLTFDDFKEHPPAATPWAANTTSNIYFSYDETDGNLNHVFVYSTFIPSKSWMKKKLPEVLSHEQLHFDITEYYARKFYAQAAGLVGQQGTQSKLKQLFADLNNECNTMQNQYDEESAHGVNEKEQSEWQEKVHKLLSDTSPYPSGN